MTSDRVAEHVGRVAELLRSCGRPGPADSLAAMLRTPAQARPSVHVVGDAKVGKSALVNALLRRPDLSPVGPEPMTSAPISFFFSHEPAAFVLRYGEHEQRAESVERALALATLGREGEESEDVQAVSVGVDNGLLASMVLVDTPGVGGLDSGHAALTLQSLGAAGALVFAITAAAPIKGPELEFLRRASQRIDTVIIALTRIDACRGWRTILDSDREIIRTQAPRFAGCPIVPVSSRLALLGLRSADPEEAASLREESGFAALESLLNRTVVERADVLRDANLLRATVGPLAALERATVAEQAATSGPQEAQQALQAEQVRLQQLNLDRADWPQALDAEIRKITLERQDAATRQTIELRHRYDERLKVLSHKEQAGLPGELIADLAALAASLNESSSQRLSEVVRDFVFDLDRTNALAETISRLAQRSIDDELAALSLGSHEMTHFERLSILGSFSSGRTIAELVSGSGLGLSATAFIAPPVALALGVGLGGLFVFKTFRSRNRQAFAAEFGPWMRDQISTLQLIVQNEFSRWMIDFQASAKQSIRDALTVREREITAAIAEARALLAAETDQRSRALEQVTARLTTVRSLRQETLRLLDGLGVERTSP